MSFQSLKGQTLGQFELRELIGAGGMGAVYLGFQPNLNRSVAVKVLLTHLVNEDGYIERFNREAQIAAALEHPHIIPIIDFGTQHGINYVVMRLLRGGTLGERVKQRQATAQQLLSLGEIADLLKQVGSALDYAHANGVIHRDIKPSNIMFDDQGTAFLVDFGIAKPMNTALEGLTAPGTSMGTIAYMSPEQWRGEELTAAIDQYAMGLVVYTLLTGRPAFEAPPNAPYAMMNKHVNEMPIPVHEVRPDIPQEVSTVVERAIAKKATDRFPTLSEMAKAFERAIRGSSGVPTGFFTFQLPKRPQLMAAMPPQTATPTPLLNKQMAEATPSKPTPPPPPRKDDRTQFDSDATNPELGEVPPAVRAAVRQQRSTNPPPVHMGTYDEPKHNQRSYLIGGIVVGVALIAGLIFILLSQQNQGAPNTEQAVSTFIAGTDTAQTAQAIASSNTQAAANNPTLDPTDVALEATTSSLSEVVTRNAARANGTVNAASTVGTPQDSAVALLPTTAAPNVLSSETFTTTPTLTITLSPTETVTLNAVEKTAIVISTLIAGETQTATLWTQTPLATNTLPTTATVVPVPPSIGLGQFEFASPVSGTGWKLPETDANGQTVVWSEGSSATLNLDLPSQDSLVVFNVYDALPDSVLPTLVDNMRLSVDAQPVPFYQRMTGSVVENVALIRAETIAALGGKVPLTFTLEAADQTGTAAFALNWLRITPEPTVTLPLRLEFDVAVPGIHWYAPEKPTTTTYQWMEGATSTILLNLPLDADLNLSFRALAEEQDQLNGLKLLVNGDTITLRPGTREGAKVTNASATISVATLKKSVGLTVITFQVPTAITIAPDPRSFGARFDFIVIELR